MTFFVFIQQPRVYLANRVAFGVLWGSSSTSLAATSCPWAVRWPPLVSSPSTTRLASVMRSPRQHITSTTCCAMRRGGRGGSPKGSPGWGLVERLGLGTAMHQQQALGSCSPGAQGQLGAYSHQAAVLDADSDIQAQILTCQHCHGQQARAAHHI